MGLTLVKKIEIGTGRELGRHIEIGDTVSEISRRPSESFNGVESYWLASLITPSQKKSKWFKKFDFKTVDEFGCIYEGTK